ncbi:MAG: hypothetical protein M0P01_06190 [Treponema sp.]|nr:hypothetical protein [Treponema sp.]
MSKKNISFMSYLYVIGMAITVIGFFTPIFSAFGRHITLNGFDLVGKGDSAMKIAVLLIFAGAAAGIIFQFVLNKSLYKLIALVVTIAGGLYCFFNTNDLGIKIAGNFLDIGFYLIITGWCVGTAGFLFARK